MAALRLFPDEQVVGVFRGFREGGMEFHADLVLPYRNDFQNIPMHGQFLLVQLETPEEAVLGRITSLSAEGRLMAGAGEEFNIRAVREDRPIPEDLREQYLRYRVNIRVLGVLRQRAGDRLVFVPSHRRLPHVGSRVAFPSPEVLREIAGHNAPGAPIGHLALGEYIYAAGSRYVREEDWMQIREPEVLVKFPVENLVSRRSFIFARAGFGKSNLNKLLFSMLYRETPTVEKRGGRRVPVGTIIFDPEGEYFWPDDKGRPGLCDVPRLQDKLVVFSERQPPSPFYGSFVAGGVRLDIRRLQPSDVVGLALSPERQEQQNVRKLKGLPWDRWVRLVNLIHQDGNQADLKEIQKLLQLDANQEVEAQAARANMTAIVRTIHDPNSRLLDMLLRALSDGKLCIVDLSQMRGGQSMILSGLILHRVFEHNQKEFTEAEPRTIPTIAVVEEAQAVLDERSSAAEPYIAWVKEGRKYDLGMLMVTQQPGSISTEILSQGDNWFIFHLLSAADLTTLRKANSHFSEDLLSSLLNEPIRGQGVFWSSVSGNPYPIPIRVLSFEGLYSPRDPGFDQQPVPTYAAKLRQWFAHPPEFGEEEIEAGEGRREENAKDYLEVLHKRAFEALRSAGRLISRMKDQGVPWWEVQKVLKEALPQDMDEEERHQYAFKLVPLAMNTVFGAEGQSWGTRRENGKTFVFLKTGEETAS
ncbi:ATP-binding protein [Kyrpidia spormannii]|uniref:ATPase n=2 Tax=Kyrpidia spormannii TaxID=2055160 RepID=A0ACA8Z5T1_9BACL|nr:ATP-binding protein [Kyrpidia spormannii]CAB3389767.1 ATPase [Kyrpidia spormannii]CAB3390663.1 ATPase [Kyrpidia spormannii]